MNGNQITLEAKKPTRWGRYSVRYTGTFDVIEVSDGEKTIQLPYYPFAPMLAAVKTSIPLPCPDCDGMGQEVFDERDLIQCTACKGSGVKAT